MFCPSSWTKSRLERPCTRAVRPDLKLVCFTSVSSPRSFLSHSLSCLPLHQLLWLVSCSSVSLGISDILYTASTFEILPNRGPHQLSTCSSSFSQHRKLSLHFARPQDVLRFSCCFCKLHPRLRVWWRILVSLMYWHRSAMNSSHDVHLSSGSSRPSVQLLQRI